MSNVLFYEGLRCQHYVYGFGTVISVDSTNDKVCIRFESGIHETFTISNLLKSDRFVTFPEEGDRNE